MGRERSLALALAILGGGAALLAALLAPVQPPPPEAPAVLHLPDWRPDLPAVPSDRSPGYWILGSLWLAVAAVGVVRAGRATVTVKAVGGDAMPLRQLLDRLPGVDPEVLGRLDRAGLATVQQLRSLDAAAIAFWAQMDEATVRHWQELAALLRWPAAPTAGARWLALLGVRSTLHLATMPAEELLAAARSGAALPGAPFDLAELAQWRKAAQEQHGLPLDHLQVVAKPLGIARRVLRTPTLS